MTLSCKIRATVIDEIEKDRSSLDYLLSGTDRRILIALKDIEIIDKKDLLLVADKKLCSEGRKCYVRHIYSLKHGPVIYPDHSFNADACAYALSHNIFCEKEESMIKFDHGDTKTSFIKQYHVEMMCERVVDSWLTPPSIGRIPLEDPDAMSTCSCEGCPV